MPKRSYAFERKGPKRLEVSWGAFWKNFTLTLDGKPIGRVADARTLRQGQEFQLPDKSTLHVQLKRSLVTELHLLRDGRPLPDSAADPVVRVRLSYSVLFFIGGLNFVFGLLGILFPTGFFYQLGVGMYNLLLGIAFLGLGFLTWRRSLVALGIAFALLLVETISRLLAGFNVGIFLNLIFLVILWQGMDALRVLNWFRMRK